jgi:hypothetical protein
VVGRQKERIEEAAPAVVQRHHVRPLVG